jgi:hypothetical protein
MEENQGKVPYLATLLALALAPKYSIRIISTFFENSRR